MSVEAFIVDAELRNDEGKGASRRLRREGKVPAVIYGGNRDPQSISMAKNIIWQQIENEAFFSHIVTVNVAGEAQKAVVKDLQMHPFKQAIVHMDFLRVDEASMIKVSVPLHFIGEDIAPGAKAGGVVTHQMTSVEVSCPAGKLPEYLEADVSAMDIGDSLHLSELKLPEGVEIVELSHGEEHDLPVVSIVASRAGSVEEEVEAAPEAGEDEAAPE
ncbi:50S ribosomal protein L25 [Candidatus Tenderia electrophaga]|jgi:large subunit ribosomal protein L25|uniref:Large ribosomal subunit protein bL25 n=1 Tax=Candidatus Tenderia electrophaga TaxID=1748243 RepID=A0A0S2TGX8_9GAMM|nr:50S ribosomal protein L25 [Candidatus Tenderia electrophaga]